MTLASGKLVMEAVRAAYAARQPIVPRGGGTSLDYGGPPTGEGRELDLTGLNRIVDYTPRDMTVIVEAGVRMVDLAATLAVEGQQLPIDVPRPAEATVGGAVATNWSGSRRYGYGTLRDYIIGVRAVDGRGVPFQAGGRVVKNVAGYDFCKLLTGSLGTLGIITQLAFKLKPLPEATTTVAARCADLTKAEALLSRLANLTAPPAALDLLLGRDWNLNDELHRAGEPTDEPILVARIEGHEPDVRWLADEVMYHMWNANASAVARLTPQDAEHLWHAQVEFADHGPHADRTSPLVLKIAVPPSAVAATMADVRKHDPACTILAHAASGIVVVRFANFAPTDISPVLVGQLRPAAIRRGGSAVVVRTTLEGLTPHIVWGGRTEATVLLERIKQQFDPHGILNPGRMVY